MNKDLSKSPTDMTKKAPGKAARKKANTGYFLIPFLMTVIALAIETFLVFNQKTGLFGAWIYNALVGMFGIAAYFIPVGVLSIAFFFNGIAENKVTVLKSIELAVFACFLSAFNSLVSVEGLITSPVSIPDYFVKGYGGEGGGVVGGLLGKLLGVLLGNVFAVVASISVCIVVLTLFIGATKPGAWYYMKELRMFGAEKTAKPKEQKKAPEKISSKEEDKKTESQNSGAVSLGQVGNVPAAFGTNKISNPFRYGTEVGMAGAKNTMTIDLRSPESKSQQISDIYSEETEEEKKPSGIKIQQPVLQSNQQGGRAYSPFADPFTKKEEFMKNGTEIAPRQVEEPQNAPFKAYSPFANPFGQNGGRQDNTASVEAELKVASRTALADVGRTAIYTQDAFSGSQNANGFTFPVLNTSGNGVRQIPSATQIQGNDSQSLGGNIQPIGAPQGSANQGYGMAQGGIDPLQSAPQGSANHGYGMAQGGINPLQSAPQGSANQGYGMAQSGINPLQSAPQGSANQGCGVAQNGINPLQSAPQGSANQGYGMAQSGINPIESDASANNTDDRAPWDIPVGATHSFNRQSASDYDEYVEDVEDEYGSSEEDAVFVKQESLPNFSTEVFKNSYADRYNAEKQRAEQETRKAPEQPEGRDRSEKLYPNYVYPSSVLLEQRPMETTVTEEDVREVRDKLLGKLSSFRIEASLVGYSAGPTVTRYEIAPGPGVTVKAITNRIDDIGLELQSDGVRIATVPGKSVIGIEVPNKKVSVVSLRSLIENRDFMEARSKITVCVGLTVTGKPVYMDIDDMPHVLIAGQTKSGKSVAINCMLLSLLYRTTPDEVQLILIDPKRVELNIYAKVPHLAMPVIDDPQRAAAALRWAVNEMERRYEIMDNLGVRNRDEYYELKAQDPSLEYLPQIVIVIDELADLMLQVREHVETLINRLAAKARACGIHLLVGTQRPSVDIVTGLIKANIPARISFQVSSGADSRTILGTAGAEKLLGRGDMLYQATGMGRVRLQGAFVGSSEIKRVTGFIIENNGEAVYDPEIMRQLDAETDKINKTSKKSTGYDSSADGDFDGDFDYENICRAMEYVLESGITSTNNIQRHLHIGFNRAADLVEQLEEFGFISAKNGSKQREILIDYTDFMDWKMRNAP